MKAIISDNISVVNEIARIVGATIRHDGYFQGQEFLVTWTSGHVIEETMPPEDGIADLASINLSLTPSEIVLRPIKKKSGTQYYSEQNPLKQLQVIGRMFEQCERIIVATEPGMEGELIFRNIYHHLNCHKPFKRLWLSSLTERSIIRGLRNLRAGSEFDGLYEAGRLRLRSDRLVSINVSTAVSANRRDGFLALGRLEIPVLAMICQQYRQHKTFEQNDLYQIELSFGNDGKIIKGKSVDHWKEKKKAESVSRCVERTGVAKIVSVHTHKDSIEAPFLFDLSELQMEANRTLGFSANRTLGIALSLYTKKFITYPKTRSRYLSEELWQDVPALILALGERPSCKQQVDHLKWERYNRHIVRNLETTDHYGILITENIPTTLDKDEDAVYDLIARRFLEAVSPACFRESVEVQISVLHYDFVFRSIRIITPGWKLINGNFEEEGDDLISEPLMLQTGMALNITTSRVQTIETKRPLLYSEARLLEEMDNVTSGSCSERKDEVFKHGIASTFVRAKIIEELLEWGYIIRERGVLLPTEKGMMVYEEVKGKLIASEKLAAQWEMALEEIEHGMMNPLLLSEKIKKWVCNITAELAKDKETKDSSENLYCPRCSSSVVLMENIVQCSDESCNWSLFRNICGVKLAYEDVKLLLVNKRSPLLKNMRTRNQKALKAYVVLSSDGSISFDFANTI